MTMTGHRPESAVAKDWLHANQGRRGKYAGLIHNNTVIRSARRPIIKNEQSLRSSSQSKRTANSQMRAARACLPVKTPFKLHAAFLVYLVKAFGIQSYLCDAQNDKCLVR
eukprot:6212644-Pleurochrysis_carterae.AAC.1